MDLGLYHLFLYATILLTAVTTAGILYYLKDRKRRSAGIPDLGDQERLLILEQEIDRMQASLKGLLEEQARLREKVGLPRTKDGTGLEKNQSPRST